MNDHAANNGRLAMADVSGKPITARRALAAGRIRLGAEAFDAVARNALPKGDARTLAEVAGILGAKDYDEAIHRDNMVLV